MTRVMGRMKSSDWNTLKNGDALQDRMRDRCTATTHRNKYYSLSGWQPLAPRAYRKKIRMEAKKHTYIIKPRQCNQSTNQHLDLVCDCLSLI